MRENRGRSWRTDCRKERRGGEEDRKRKREKKKERRYRVSFWSKAVQSFGREGKGVGMRGMRAWPEKLIRHGRMRRIERPEEGEFNAGKFLKAGVDRIEYRRRGRRDRMEFTKS